MQGYDVLHPMGWDAFGLPTERQATKEGIHPAVVTERNTKLFKQQPTFISPTDEVHPKSGLNHNEIEK